MTELQMKQKGMISRLTNKTFKFDKRIKDQIYVAAYFTKTQKIVQELLPNHIVSMQFFCRYEGAKLCGIDEAIALIKTFANNSKDILIEALNDGDIVSSEEPVLRVTGKYEDFGFLEGMIDGILARSTSIATNVNEIVKIIPPQKLFYMGDRDDLYINHQHDGYAVYIGGGVEIQCTPAMHEYTFGVATGTMPHALIQMCQGDLIKACKLYQQIFPNDNLSALVDYTNDVVTESLKVLREFKDKLYSVRVDTSKSLVDKCVQDLQETKEGEYHGVNLEQIKRLREALDKNGGQHVKIIVSSGFDLKRVKEMEEAKAPVDYYGIGSSILKLKIGFTGDLVRIDGKNEAKVGRFYRENPRLKKVD